jgi:hypothetical protein
MQLQLGQYHWCAVCAPQVVWLFSGEGGILARSELDIPEMMSQSGKNYILILLDFSRDFFFNHPTIGDPLIIYSCNQVDNWGRFMIKMYLLEHLIILSVLFIWINKFFSESFTIIIFLQRLVVDPYHIF